MRVVYYALGGGHGHAVRGLAVLRRLTPLLPGGELALVAPARLGRWAREEGIRLLAPPHEVNDIERLARWLGDEALSPTPDLLLVDTFPRGVLGELPEALEERRPRMWLVSRWVRPHALLHRRLRPWIGRRFQRLLWCEAPAPSLRQLDVPQVDLSAILIRSPEECLEREEARRRLGVPEEQSLVLAVGTGDREHQEDLLSMLVKAVARVAGQLARRLALRFLSDDLPPGGRGLVRVEARYPAMAVLRAADVVVGAGGYHLVNEVRALGLRGVFVPQRRPLDDQFRRVGDEARAASPEELERKIAGILAGDLPAAGGARPVADGAGALAELVRAELRSLPWSTAPGPHSG